ncbi:MAG: hypothetical protein LWY06_07705 [Firmicutes bacterium]|nr:hypothetical protein [Bacillota bacterium]
MDTKYRLNLQTQQVIEAAKTLAARFGHTAVDSGHLLLTILNNADSKAYIVMESMGIQLYEVENAYKKMNPFLGRFVDSIDLSGELTRALNNAELKAESSHNTISLQELFEAIFTDSHSIAVKTIESLGYPIETVISEMRGM